jgi:transcriptional regulator with XRE-family HTH domain
MFQKKKIIFYFLRNFKLCLFFLITLLKFNAITKECDLCMNKINFEIGLRLKIARLTAGYKTAKEFYTLQNISKSTYSQHEQGIRALTSDLIIKYAELLEINPAWLLTGGGHPCPIVKQSDIRKKLIEDMVEEYRANNILSFSSHYQINIQDEYSVVNMSLLSKILEGVFEAIHTYNVAIKAEEIILNCIDIYNSIEHLETTKEQKLKIIDIAISSIIKGSKNHIHRYKAQG